jgi:hypothetical protein
MTMPDTQGAGSPYSGIDTDSQETGGARGQFRQVKDQVVDQAKSTLREARDRATSSLADSRRQAADQVGGLASALHSAGQHLRQEEQERIAGLADSFADQVDQVASYLRDVDVQRVARDVETLARRQPALVFGAAFALGLLGARFLKSSERRPATDEYDDYEDYGYESIRAGGQPAGLGYSEAAEIAGPGHTTGGRNVGA